MSKAQSIKQPSFSEKILASQKEIMPRAIITFGIGHPFDLVKTRMQANPYIHSAALLWDKRNI